MALFPMTPVEPLSTSRNDQAWGATLHTQQFLFGLDHVTNNRLQNGSYSGVARALGADGVDVTELNQLGPASRSTHE